MQCLTQQQVPTGKPVQQLAISTVSASRKKSYQQQPHSTHARSSAADDASQGPQAPAATAAGAVTDVQTEGVQEADALNSAHGPADLAQADAKRAEGGPDSDEAKFKTIKASSGPEADGVQQAGLPSPSHDSCRHAQQCSALIAARGSYQIMILQAVQAARYSWMYYDCSKDWHGSSKGPCYNHSTFWQAYHTATCCMNSRECQRFDCLLAASH